MKKTILIIFLVLLSVGTGIALAGHHKKGFWHDRSWEMDHMVISHLDLTPEQSEEVKSLTETFQEEMAPLRKEKFQFRTELRLLWMQEKADPEKIKSKQKEFYDLLLQIMEKITDYRLSFRKILTSEQLSRFLAHEAERSFGLAEKPPFCPIQEREKGSHP